MKWPAGFMFGTGASSTQCEGAAPASDWWDWERAGHAPVSGDGNGFATRYPEDFRILAGLGLTHHRLSIEWARVEPEPGLHDERAVAHYPASSRNDGAGPPTAATNVSMARATFEFIRMMGAMAGTEYQVFGTQDQSQRSALAYDSPGC